MQNAREPMVNPLDVLQTGTLGFQLDWVSYFREFSRVNGDDPVQYNDKGVKKLLFRTGWAYSAINHRGPEYPPPQETKERLELIQYYWKKRKEELNHILEDLSESVERLRAVQESRSQPLFISELVWDDQKGKPVTQHGPIQFETLTNRIQRLRDLIAQCDTHLGTI